MEQFEEIIRMALALPNSQTIISDADRAKKSKSREDLVALNSEKNVQSRLKTDYLSIRDNTGIERILGKNNLVDINTLQKGLDLSKTVCRIIRMRREQIIPQATGFLISDRLLMTNNHVIGDPELAKPLLAEFDFEKDKNGRIGTTYTFKFAPEYFFATNEDLDYTIIGLDQIATNDPQKKLSDYGYARLAVMEDELLKGESISIIQHPAGEPKKIAMRDSQISDLSQLPYILYTTDTRRGSSGSLVCNDDWQVIALHSRSVPELRGEKIVLTDGSLWQRSSDNERIKWIANRGTVSDRILHHLQSQKLKKPMEKIKNNLLQEYFSDLQKGAYELPV